MRDEPPRRARALLALSAVAAFSPCLFALTSAVVHARSPEADPAAVLWSSRSSLVERAAVTGYVVAAIATVAGPSLIKRPSLSERAFDALIAVSVVAALVGGALWP